MTEIVCKECGNTLKVGARFCGKCGQVSPQSSVPKSHAHVAAAPTTPSTPPVTQVESPPAKRHGGRVAILAVLAVIILCVGTVAASRYAQEHSPSGRNLRLGVAAGEGDITAIQAIIAESKAAGQPLDLNEALYSALSSDQQGAADQLLLLGANESKARERLDQVHQTLQASGISAEQNVIGKGNDRASFLVTHDLTYLGQMPTKEGKSVGVRVEFVGIGDMRLFWDGKRIPATMTRDKWNSDQVVITSKNERWGMRKFAVASNDEALTEIGGDEIILFTNLGGK